MTDYRKDPVKHKVTMIVTESGVVDFDFEGAENLPIGKMERYMRRANRVLRGVQVEIRRKQDIQRAVDAVKQVEIDKVENKKKSEAAQAAEILKKNPDVAIAVKQQLLEAVDKVREKKEENA